MQVVTAFPIRNYNLLGKKSQKDFIKSHILNEIQAFCSSSFYIKKLEKVCGVQF